MLRERNTQQEVHMTASEVATTQGASVPALAGTPATELNADDITLPQVKLGQFMSDLVQQNAVPAGSIFASQGSDDPDPQILWEQGNDGHVKFYVLSLKKGKSVSADGELVLFDYNDPDAPENAWVTYKYTIAIPEVDEDMPFTWLFTRTGKPAAQQINTVIAKNAAQGPAYKLAFGADCVERSNKKGKYFVPRVKPLGATEDEIAVAEKLYNMIAPQTQAAPAQEATATAEPAI